MTLNITIVGPEAVTQVSDRRGVDQQSGVLEDTANKAIVIGFSHSFAAITFTGVGTFGTPSSGKPQRIDWWLAERMQDAGIPELGPADAATFIAEEATKLFKRFPPDSVISHAFVIAGFDFGNGQSPQAFGQVVHNSSDVGVPQRVFGADAAYQPPSKGSGILVTGMKPAFGRACRRRMEKALARQRTVDGVEVGLVQAIRDAASNPQWGWAIGRSCMAVSLSVSRIARATFYPEQGSAHSFGPLVLWNSGSTNLLARDIDVLPGAGYRIAFGGEPSGFALAVGQSTASGGPLLPISERNKLVAEMSFRASNAKFGPPGKPGDETQIMRILTN